MDQIRKFYNKKIDITMTTEYHPSDFQILETETGYTQK